MKFRLLYILISLIIILPGIYSLVTHGLKLSLDFTGGSLLEVRVLDEAAISEISFERLEQQFEGIYELTEVEQLGTQNFLLKGSAISNDVKNGVLTTLTNQITPVEEVRFETVGPVLGRELLIKTVVATVLVILIITFYLAYQFKEFKFGISAVIALLHDTLVIVGSFSLLGYYFGAEVDVLFMTALLTSVSFSVHDTIVVFDRVREFRKKNVRLSVKDTIDAALLQTLSRSLNNSITVILMLASLVLLGGDSIRWFAVALLIGALTGTYSSAFVATPLLLWWHELDQRFSKKK
ncbi:MAG: protein translocase subunit SecF [bacterium]|nr:protein translocase subunit SecF [bacterium]